MKVSEEDKEKIIIVCKRYAKSFFSLCLLAIFSQYVFSSTKSCRYLFGSVLTATGVFAKSGWDLQTWCGVTKPEKLDKWLFWVSSGVGFFLLVSA